MFAQNEARQSAGNEHHQTTGCKTRFPFSELSCQTTARLSHFALVLYPLRKWGVGGLENPEMISQLSPLSSKEMGCWGTSKLIPNNMPESSIL